MFTHLRIHAYWHTLAHTHTLTHTHTHTHTHSLTHLSDVMTQHHAIAVDADGSNYRAEKTFPAVEACVLTGGTAAGNLSLIEVQEKQRYADGFWRGGGGVFSSPATTSG